MISGLSIAFLFASQATALPASAPPGSTAAADPDAPTSYGPAVPPAPKPPRSAATSAPCSTPPPVDEDKGEVFVCAPRPEGYRIDTDVLKASKQHRNRVKPKRPERLADTSCASVGPHGCPTQGVDLVNAAVVLATMAQKAVKGENVGEMFITDRQLTEYELYKIAKAEREAREAEQAATAKAKAAAEPPAVTSEPR